MAAAGQRYRIENVPAGRHTVRCWNEELGSKDVTVEVPQQGSVTADCSMQ